jgi:8-oxo-dGTP pyrophosphatase MutT (NUDIX family)
MAKSTPLRLQFPSSDFVESCGAVLFDLSDPHNKRVCIGNVICEDQWVLFKGRRNIGETRKDAALREVREETGYKCDIVPVTMPTRACAPDAPANVSDKARIYDSITEPFMCTVREISNGVKIIWWFIAKLDVDAARGPGEDTFKSEFFVCNEALMVLHFDNDREVLKKAIELIEDTLSRDT